MTETITLRGTVRRVFFADSESPFMAGVVDVSDGGKPVDVRFAGPLFANVGDTVEMTGEWGTHPKYGRQFQAATGVARMDESPDALAHLLASHQEFAGVGPKRAKRIVECALRLSDDGELGSSLEKYSSEIAQAAGVQQQVVDAAARVWNGRKAEFDALAQLVDQGWGNSQAARLYERFGASAPSVARSNPYALIGLLPRFGFRTVDSVARQMGIASDAPERMAAGVAFVLDRISESGHTWVETDTLVYEAEQELRPDTFAAQAAIGDALDALIASGDVYSGTWRNGERVVASAALLRCEVEVFRLLRDGLSDNNVREVNLDAVADVVGTLNAGQRAAIEGFSQRRFAVISGGAGTGKTYTMDAVALAAEAAGLRVALCAPTGKAARRLSESTGRDAKTIHRLLEPIFEGGEFRFQRGPGVPLDADLVVVDEVSMVDVRLMRSLLTALRPSARLLLVGDHQQIPSVGAGAVLRDVLAERARFSGAIHILDHVVRQAGRLAQNTNGVLEGRVDASCDDVWRFNRTERGHEEGVAGMVADLYESAIISEGFDAVWGVQVLAPMKGGPCGVNAINAAVQARRQRVLGNPPPPPLSSSSDRPKPVVGDRVIWTKNDYDLGLMNGTQAIVREIRKGGAMLIETEDGEEKLVDAGKRKHVEVAYALTIHKAQGSEWPAVILSISSKHYIMRDRNLLYTGCSRAARQLTIVGDAAGVHAFAGSTQSQDRRTFGALILSGWDGPSSIGELPQASNAVLD